jgi:hypothetical protein
MAIQMSSEHHRRGVIDAFETASGDSAFAIPLESVTTREPLLLVIVAENQYLQPALAAVLSIDPRAGYPPLG